MKLSIETSLRVLTLCVWVCLLFGCGAQLPIGDGESAPETRGIRNGSNDNTGGVFPDVRRLHQYESPITPNAFHCSSVAISSRLLLTAGHCADRYRNAPAQYQMFSPTGTYIPAASVVVHPDYRFSNPIATMDFAIVELDNYGFDGFMNASGQVDPNGRYFRRFYSGATPDAGRLLTAAGFGEDGASNGTNHFRLFGNMIFARAESAETVSGGEVAGGLWELGPSNGQVTCAGDSGGPIVVDGRIGGVASFVSFVGSNYTCGAVVSANYAVASKAGEWIDRVARKKDPMNECQHEGIFSSRDGGCKSPTGLVVGREIDIPGKGNQLDWDYASSYCEQTEEAGQSDWRLPSEAELQGFLALDGANNAAVDKTADYWTSNVSSSTARAVSFVNGTASDQPRSSKRRVVCVRG